MEGDFTNQKLYVIDGISIHTLRMEGDALIPGLELFLLISIHTLRMEGDEFQLKGFIDANDFNPHPPHGG